MAIFTNHHVLFTGDVETIKTIIENHLSTIIYEPNPLIEFNSVGVHGYCLAPEFYDGAEIKSPCHIGLEQRYHSQMGSMDEFINALRARYPSVEIEYTELCGNGWGWYPDDCKCGRVTDVDGEWIVDETKTCSIFPVSYINRRKENG
jgi:hypothetical protein